jgi:hypothetical protein
MTLRLRGWNIGLICLGVALIIVSLIWLLIILPSMVKLPTDHHKIVNFEG